MSFVTINFTLWEPQIEETMPNSSSSISNKLDALDNKLDTMDKKADRQDIINMIFAFVLFIVGSALGYVGGLNQSKQSSSSWAIIATDILVLIFVAVAWLAFSIYSKRDALKRKG